MKIFLSYRRGDRGSEETCAHIQTLLTRNEGFASDNLFWDKGDDGLVSGAEYPSQLEDALEEADIIIAVICSPADWAGEGKSTKGKPTRLHEVDDWVRKEVLAGLTGDGKLMVPLLIGDAGFPSEHLLPPEFITANFRVRQGISVKSADLDDKLNDWIKQWQSKLWESGNRRFLANQAEVLLRDFLIGGAANLTRDDLLAYYLWCIPERLGDGEFSVDLSSDLTVSDLGDKVIALLNQVDSPLFLFRFVCALYSRLSADSELGKRFASFLLSIAQNDSIGTISTNDFETITNKLKTSQPRPKLQLRLRRTLHDYLRLEGSIVIDEESHPIAHSAEIPATEVAADLDEALSKLLRPIDRYLSNVFGSVCLRLEFILDDDQLDWPIECSLVRGDDCLSRFWPVSVRLREAMDSAEQKRSTDELGNGKIEHTEIKVAQEVDGVLLSAQDRVFVLGPVVPGSGKTIGKMIRDYFLVAGAWFRQAPPAGTCFSSDFCGASPAELPEYVYFTRRRRPTADPLHGLSVFFDLHENTAPAFDPEKLTAGERISSSALPPL